jgi:acetyltransferase
VTCQIHHCPAELIHVACARHEGVTIRPMLPRDGDALQAFFRSLSDVSRRNRLLGPCRELPTKVLRQLTSLDSEAHFALVATTPTDGADILVAEARYAIVEPAVAEVAIAVADAWQGRGLGRALLLRLLCRAADKGVQRIFGEALPTNKAVQRLARSFGLAVLPGSLGLLRLELRLGATVATPCADGAALGKGRFGQSNSSRGRGALRHLFEVGPEDRHADPDAGAAAASRSNRMPARRKA